MSLSDAGAARAAGGVTRVCTLRALVSPSTSTFRFRFSSHLRGRAGAVVVLARSRSFDEVCGFDSPSRSCRRGRVRYCTSSPRWRGFHSDSEEYCWYGRGEGAPEQGRRAGADWRSLAGLPSAFSERGVWILIFRFGKPCRWLAALMWRRGRRRVEGMAVYWGARLLRATASARCARSDS